MLEEIFYLYCLCRTRRTQCSCFLAHPLTSSWWHMFCRHHKGWQKKHAETIGFLVFGTHCTVLLTMQLCYSNAKWPVLVIQQCAPHYNWEVFSKHSMRKRKREIFWGLFHLKSWTILLLGHHSTATDGTNITINLITRVDLGNSVVTTIEVWLHSSPQKRKCQPYILHRNHKQLVSG